jgi:hypothetical protein
MLTNGGMVFLLIVSGRTERIRAMREVQLSLPELALLVGTRAALGAGLGLLLADSLPESRRRAVGWTLLLVGAVTTVPLAFEVLGKVHASTPAELPYRSVGGR